MFPNRFVSQQRAEGVVIALVRERRGGWIPAGSTFEFVRDGEAYARFLTKRLAQINAVGVAAAAFGSFAGQ
jgi:hypothetical protein